jgi:hypothetical protein
LTGVHHDPRKSPGFAGFVRSSPLSGGDGPIATEPESGADAAMSAPSVHGVRPLDGLTSLRFFAAAMVLVYHYWRSYLPGVAVPIGLDLGYAGVTFFFVLSGFILAYNYESAGAFPRHELGRYRVARLARIWPVHLLAILVFLPFFAADLMRQGVTLDRVLAEIGRAHV